jgi:hypothetical protein
MMDFDHLFQIDNKHKILICTGCQYAIVPLHLTTHLRVYHPRFSLEQCRDFVTKVEGCSTLANTYEEVVYPTLIDPPIPYLPIYFNGLRCD